MAASKDPEKRAAQLRNLRPDAATTHGVYSESKLAPLRTRFGEQLQDQFGAVATADEIGLAADRRAKLEVLNVWLEQRGLLADRRSGRPRAVLQLADRIQTAYERQIASLIRRGGPRSWDPAPPMEIEMDDAERLGLRSSDPAVRAETSHRILARIANGDSGESLGDARP